MLLMIWTCRTETAMSKRIFSCNLN